MRKLFVTEFLALDGVFEEPGDWPKGYWNEEIEKYKLDELFASDAMVLGRVTYEVFAKEWPTMKEDDSGFVDRMNTIPKYVVSKSMKKAAWNNTTIIHDNVVKELAKLKKEPGKDIMIAGSGNLIHTLIDQDIVDEFRVLLYPFILGKGKRLFQDGDFKTFKLVKSKKFKTGVMALHYEPKKK